MLGLLKNCQLVLTDSGGLQKEAYFFKKPCITLRNETEWVELVENNFNRIVGVDSNSIFAAYEAFSNEQPNFDVELYGGGKAGEEIVRVLVGR
jgi:UDP-GlcNAc3NAcA epimerase